MSHLRENLSKETLEKMSKSHKEVPSHRKGLSVEEEYGLKRAKLIKQKNSESKKGLYVGENNPRWNGGVKYSRGYVFIYKPNHPNNVQGYVQEHRLIMEQHIGRYLKSKEVIHHINGIKKDNRIENLMLLKNESEHKKLHKVPKGEMSPSWRGGLSFEFYPKTFNEKLKEKIRNKYNRICQLCGVKESKLKGYFKRLAIHHINYIKKDCREENFVPLCHSCNAITRNGDRDYWTKLLSQKIVK